MKKATKVNRPFKAGTLGTINIGEYDKLIRMRFNRSEVESVDNERADKIRKLIKEGDYIETVYDVIINELVIIIDGHHREHILM